MQKKARPPTGTRQLKLTICAERIKEFLSNFNTQEKDLIDGMADIDLRDDEDTPDRTKNSKYLHQLVRCDTFCYILCSKPSHSKG